MGALVGSLLFKMIGVAAILGFLGYKCHKRDSRIEKRGFDKAITVTNEKTKKKMAEGAERQEYVTKTIQEKLKKVPKTNDINESSKRLDIIQVP